MAPPVIRPENVLRRAEELIAVGKGDSALQVTHEFLISKRTRAVAPITLEPIALLFVKLSVDAKKGFTLKDGLHQFKKNIQSNDSGLQVLETVTRKLVQVAEQKLESIQEKVGLAEEGELDVNETPEDVLLSSMSNEESKDRADREAIFPWIRFLWECYRLVLELLRNNSQLEIAYFDIVQQAYQFCLKYNRTIEFKRLSDLLRGHILNTTIYSKLGSKSANAIDLQDPETLQRSLELRFNQLNISVKLKLWQEAFKTVEDIHNLISVSKRVAKPNMMVSYYENLAEIFLVSDNALFHSAAWHRFFNLYSQSPNATEEQLVKYSSIFLLSSLAIPQGSYNLDFSEDYSRHAKKQLAALLNLPKRPTRKDLIQSALSKNVYDFVDPVVKQLYKLLETDFHPLSIREELRDISSKLRANKLYAPYTKALVKVILNRLFERVSQVYESVKLDFLIQIATFEGDFKLSELEIESFLLNAGRDGQLSFHIDHDAGVVTFHNDPFAESYPTAADPLQSSPAELVRAQLSNLAKTLYASSKFIDPSYAERQKLVRERLITSATEALRKEREELEKSRELLEKRKEQADQEKRERELEIARERQKRLDDEKAAEAKRIEEETKRRDAERLQREQEALKRQENKQLLDDITAKGIKLEIDNIDNVDKKDILTMQVQHLEKEKKDTESRVKALFKRLDHTERAYRKYELSALEKDAETQQDRDRKAYEEFKAKKIALAKKEHEGLLQLKNRLQKFLPEYDSFREKIGSQAKAKRDALIKENSEKLAIAKKQRLKEVRQKRYDEKVAEYEVALARQAEEEKLRKEAEARNAEEKKRAEQEAKRKEMEALVEAKLNSQKPKPATGSYKVPSRHNLSSSPTPFRPSRSVGGSASGGTFNSNAATVTVRSDAPPANRDTQTPPPPAATKTMSFAEKMRLKRGGKR